MPKISEAGLIDNEGKLHLPFDRLNPFFASNKNKRVIVQFEAEEHGSTAAQLTYYRKYIVPTIQAALLKEGERKTEKQVDKWLRQQCGSCYNDYGGLLEAQEMTQSDFSDFIDWLKQFAAEHLFVYVEDAKSI